MRTECDKVPGMVACRISGRPYFLLLLVALACCPLRSLAQKTSAPRYTNPVLFADYSDPDIIRDGRSFYLVSSSFSFVPGLPILESPDLVHWTIVAHVLPKIEIDPKYNMTGGNRYGGGVWAPSIRKHNGLFYVYFPTPDEGIFVSTAKNIKGPWSKPVAVIAGPGLEDPCPLWDDDGTAYLIHSRKGAGPLILHRMAADGLSVLDAGKEIVNDPKNLHTLEGPKLYKRNGWYYIFAPFGGVSTGAQAVLRSKNIYGPYEHRVVLAKGTTNVNGPHQGGYVDAPDGKGWFLHFQSRGGHGRIDWLEPVRWEDDWPIIGFAPPGVTTGEPVMSGPMPVVLHPPSRLKPQTSDEFSSVTLGQQWEWNHNPVDSHWSLTAHRGYLRLIPGEADGLLTARNTLTEMMQDESLRFTTRIELDAMQTGVHAGLAMFEKADSGLEIEQMPNGSRRLNYFHLADRVAGPAITGKSLQLRLEVDGQTVHYSYSMDNGTHYEPLGPVTPITFSWWKGSRPALFAYTTAADGNAGHIDFDWVHYTPMQTPATNGLIATATK
jgi:beta-xylosidase